MIIRSFTWVQFLNEINYFTCRNVFDYLHLKESCDGFTAKLMWHFCLAKTFIWRNMIFTLYMGEHVSYKHLLPPVRNRNTIYWIAKYFKKYIIDWSIFCKICKQFFIKPLKISNYCIFLNLIFNWYLSLKLKWWYIYAYTLC